MTDKVHELVWNCSSWVNTTERLWWQVNINASNGIVPPDNKPLPETMFIPIYVAMWPRYVTTSWYAIAIKVYYITIYLEMMVCYYHHILTYSYLLESDWNHWPHVYMRCLIDVLPYFVTTAESFKHCFYGVYQLDCPIWQFHAMCNTTINLCLGSLSNIDIFAEGEWHLYSAKYRSRFREYWTYWSIF